MSQLDHVGWAVRSIDASRPHFEVALGLAFCGEEGFPGLRIAFFGAGPAQVELLEPLDERSDVGAFIESHGEGVHHLALRVEDVGAALDVTDPEPLPGDHPLLQAPTLTVVPHVGSATHATREAMGNLAVENLAAALRGKRMPHCANPEVYDTAGP